MSSNDVAGVNLKEPEQVDWDKVGAGSSYTPPPPAVGADGKNIVYFGQLPTAIATDVNDDGYRTYTFDPIKIVKSGQGADGYVLRFSRTTLKPFKNNSNSTAVLLKAAGIVAKPQKTAEYDAVVKQVGGKVVPFTIDWEARNKDTGEKVSGYVNFPDDPQRPGFKKSILKKGDTVTVDGAPHVVESEVLFANARLRFFEVKGK
jgi:hypothetical protein